MVLELFVIHFGLRFIKSGINYFYKLAFSIYIGSSIFGQNIYTYFYEKHSFQCCQ